IRPGKTHDDIELSKYIRINITTTTCKTVTVKTSCDTCVMYPRRCASNKRGTNPDGRSVCGDCRCISPTRNPGRACMSSRTESANLACREKSETKITSKCPRCSFRLPASKVVGTAYGRGAFSGKIALRPSLRKFQCH